jgi:hypothetical protein
MSVPSTPEPQKILVSQSTRGLNAMRFSDSSVATTAQTKIFVRHTKIVQ